MEASSLNIKNLCERWQKLRGVIVSGNKVEYEFFKSTFEETEKTLSTCFGSDSVNKSYLELIISAYKFVHTDTVVMDAFSQATVVITERMLHHFVLDQDKSAVQKDGVYVYVLEEKQQIYINFNNIDESLNSLIRVIERGF